jgi:hypothetical protein
MIMERSTALLESMTLEFPGFAIRKKGTSRLQRLLGGLLRVVTFGQQRTYVTQYYTVLFGVLWVPESWDLLPDKARYVLLRHERVHLRQRKRLGDLLLALVYLVPIFPLGLAWGRARIEWEAYRETLRATAEVYGMDAARGLGPEIVRRFVGGDYGWMWPFPKTVARWVEEELERIQGSETEV